MRPFSLFLFAAAIFAACKETPDDYNPDPGQDYYPLTVGKFVEYQMDSTIFDPNGDTTVYQSTYFLKEEIVDTLTDNNGNLLFRIEQYQRASDTLPWAISKVLTASIQDNQAIRTEDNLRFIKLIFPVKKNKSWDGNVHFQNSQIVTVAGESLEMFKGWGYRIRLADEPATVGNFTFDKTITVEEAENENLIELRRSNAVYAKNIGLVYREVWVLDTQCIDDCIGQPWEEKAEKGFILKQTIINHN